MIVVLMAGLILTGCTTPTPTTPTAPTTPTTAAPAKVFELKWTLQDPPTAWQALAVTAAAKRIEEATSGRIKTTVYPAEMLAKAMEQYDAVAAGTADLGLIFQGQFVGKFPLTEIIGQPFLPVPDAEIGSIVQWKLFEKFPAMQAEYPGIKPLSIWTSTPFNGIYMVNKPIYKMEDLKGMKIRVSGAILSEEVKALGAAPTLIPMPELYLSLQKGVVDGAILHEERVLPVKLNELCKYVTTGGVSLHTPAFAVIMNPKAWDSLPKDLQVIVYSLIGGLEGARYFGFHVFGPFPVAAGIKALKDAKVTKITITPEEVAKWRDATKYIATNYIAGLQAKGIPAQQIYDECVRLLGEYQTQW